MYSLTVSGFVISVFCVKNLSLLEIPSKVVSAYPCFLSFNKMDKVGVLVDEAGFEPATSTMPTWRSCQTDLLAQTALASELKSVSLNKRFL